MKVARRLIRALLIASLSLEVAAISGNGLLGWRASRRSLAGAGLLPPVEGYRVNYGEGLYKAQQNCVVYRMVSQRCAACARKEPSWQSLLRSGISGRCEFVVLLPNLQVGSYYQTAAGAVLLAWVPLEWAKTVDIVETPTTIATERGRVIWSHEGEIASAEFPALAAKIARLHSSPPSAHGVN
ncbi:MAG TPA: hypothetical protein VN690_00090 [Terriglobales bacterium]|nr:hypothetical protein [Terriglobales bacterium]